MLFIACNNKSNQGREVQLLTDSTSFNNNTASDTASLMENTGADNRMATSKQPAASHRSSGTTKGDDTYRPASNRTAGQGQGTTEKKGWSKAAQGAVIGGATGAVGGAIISKNKGAGAAVGAAVGAAGGYIIGREQDKKDGRVPKKKKQ